MGISRSAVIPVWNGRADLERLLKSISRQTLPFDEVIAIDNGSTDGAGDHAAQWGARVVRFAENRGFAAAVNRGVAESAGNWIAILNTDVELAPEWLERLLESAVTTAAWFATGLILSAENPRMIDGSWDLVSRACMPWRVGNGASRDLAVFQSRRQVSLAPFTAILMRKELWEKAGTLDERFESYLEDVDFGLRCAALGLPGIYEPGARCFHKGSASLGRWHASSIRQMARNQVFLVYKHLPAELRRRWWWSIFIGQALWGVTCLRHGVAWSWAAGKYAGVRGRRELVSRNTPEIGFVFRNLELSLFDLREQCGWDAYWRQYRRLTSGPESSPELGHNDTGAEHE